MLPADGLTGRLQWLTRLRWIAVAGVFSVLVVTVFTTVFMATSTIQACVQVVRSNLAGPLSAKGRDILERAERRSRSLLTFVRDLLDLSKMRARTDMEVMINLVGDGVKYTMPGGEVAIALNEQPGQDFIELIVSDSGIGIDDEDLPHILDDFYRAKNVMTLEKEGSGLGLSIVKQIVDSSGGRIWAESESGKGTQFHLVLSRAEPPEGANR